MKDIALLTLEYGNMMYIAHHYARHPESVSDSWQETYKREFRRTKDHKEAYSIANKASHEILKHEVGGGLMLRLIKWTVAEK